LRNLKYVTSWKGKILSRVRESGQILQFGADVKVMALKDLAEEETC
jgi:hypothetical protein